MNRPDTWNPLCEFTDVRIILGRSGTSLPTREVLSFDLVYTRARDAIYQPFASQQLMAPLAALGLDALTVCNAVPDHHIYLRRPDLERQLADESRANLAASGVRPADLLLVIGDGLSPQAAECQAVSLVCALLPYLQTLSIGPAPVVLTHQSQVALRGDVGETLKTRVMAILISERSGLSSPDSLDVYLTWQPCRQHLEPKCNCISNTRSEGLSHDAAAFELAWLLEQVFLHRVTGVQLKGESDNPALYRKTKPLSPLKE